MPVVKLTIEKMSLLLGKKITVEQLEEAIPWIGVEIEEKGHDWIRIEYNPNRPDFSSQQGVARALKGLQEIELGLPRYDATRGKVSLTVDPSVRDVRPYIVGAVCRNIRLSGSDIEELMAAQEDIHWAIGRGRRKASIGLHNLDAVAPPFKYKAVDPRSIRFMPLGGDKPLNLAEIVAIHPKGIAYRHLVEGSSKYPIIADMKDQVLSFPPIINGTVTQVTEATRNLFIDVTGTTLNSINSALNIIVTQLADMGGKIESVTIVEGEKERITPLLKPDRATVSTSHLNDILGLKLSPDRIAFCLRKSRFDAKVIDHDELSVMIPPYRVDVLHEVDLAEEAAIGYGYFNIKPKLPTCLTTGRTHIMRRLESSARRLMIGLGYQEIMNLTLTNEVEHYEYMKTTGTPLVKLTNPVSSEYTILRETLIPGLMRTLRTNKGERSPQRIFEVGDVVRSDSESDTGVAQQLHCAAATTHSSANFSEIKSILVAFLGEYVNGTDRVSFSQAEHPSFIRGRAAEAFWRNKRIAILGELHPEVIANFELEYPVVAFESDIEPFLSKMER